METPDHTKGPAVSGSAPYEVAVTAFVVTPAGHTEYSIQTKHGQEIFQAQQRFSSFLKLHEALVVQLPALPKNLKKSLSGESIKDVSPPIKAFSYDCIAL